MAYISIMRNAPSSEAAETCPMCGAGVHYLGHGRRPIYCSTRCKNRAANVRAAVRDGAPVVEVVRVTRQRHERPEPATGSERDRRDAAAIRRIRRSPRLQRELFEAIRGDLVANRYWYTDHPRSPWHSARVAVARLAELWLPHRQFETPQASTGEIDDATIERLKERLERDDLDYPE